MSRNIVTRRSAIHGNGVFAARDLPAGIEVVEYRGRLRTHAWVDRIYRETLESGHTFLFTLNERYVIDGNEDANDARWINHSCAPNCKPWMIEHEGKDRRRDRIVIETLRDIAAGEELTYDYGIRLDVRHTPRLKQIWACRCGAPACSGTMLKPKR
ncbi:MAG: SET domain-containing protein-lysine N-methyltransferase [Nevskia sp.]